MPKITQQRDKSPQNSNLSLAPNSGLLILPLTQSHHFTKALWQRPTAAQLGRLLTPPPIQHVLGTNSPALGQPMTLSFKRGQDGAVPSQGPFHWTWALQDQGESVPQGLYPLLDHAADPRRLKILCPGGPESRLEPEQLPQDLSIHKSGTRSQALKVAEGGVLLGADRYWTFWLGVPAYSC